MSARTPQLGDRVRFTRLAGRYYFWDEVPEGPLDPEWDPPGPHVTSRDGIPEAERAAIVARLEQDDDAWATDGCNHNNGTCGIHVWEAEGEGVLIGKTSRTVGIRTTDDDGNFTGMALTKTTQFHEVRTTLRGRRLIVPLDALEVLPDPAEAERVRIAALLERAGSHDCCREKTDPAYTEPDYCRGCLLVAVARGLRDDTLRATPALEAYLKERGLT